MAADGSATGAFLRSLGVADLPAATSPFDPGYDPLTVEAHLEQSGHLISILKISMATWLVADESSVRRKLEAARGHGVATTTGGGPFEVAVAQGRLDEYLDLCADVGFDRIECGSGFTEMTLAAEDVVSRAGSRGLDVQYELGEKHAGGFNAATVANVIGIGRRWLDAGAVELVIEARESAAGVGLFDDTGVLDAAFANRFVEAFGLEVVSFEAPNKPSQFALIDELGPRVRLCNVRLEELLRVEIYRRGLHSDAFRREHLRPRAPGS
jgi:phosphosulfolactate synthase